MRAREGGREWMKRKFSSREPIDGLKDGSWIENGKENKWIKDSQPKRNGRLNSNKIEAPF